MAKLSHSVEYWLARAGVAFVNSLSAKAADSFGAGLGSVAHRLLKSRRRIATDNLKQAFGDRFTDEEIEGIVKKVFQNIGRTLVEFSRFGKIKLEGARQIVVGDGGDILEKAHREGKGAIFLTAHFGSWELLGSWVAALGYPIEFLIGTQHNEKIDKLLVGFRREMGVGIIRLRTSLRGVFKSLQTNHIAGIVADQHDAARGLIMDFFGRKASVPKGPAAFALRAGCPLLPFMMRRERYDRHVVMAGEAIYPPNSGDDEKDIRDMTTAYLRFFESIISRYPDQWMWTHRRWKV